MEPYRLFSKAPASIDERAGIFGLETEYAVLYLPEDPSDQSTPEFSLIQEVLFASLLAGRKAASSAGLKGGYFLENGGLVHLEIYLRHQSDTPILEASTPECRNPWDLLVYSRAFDELLSTVSSKSAAALQQKGFQGRIAFAKNNRDARGIGYGCHENYLVHLKATRLQKIVFVLFLPLLFTCMLPTIAILMALLLIACPAIVVTRLFPKTQDLALTVYGWMRARPWLLPNLTAVYYLVSSLVLLPGIWVYSRLLKLLAFRPFVRDATAFLVTRQVLAGSGRLNFRRRCFELSQRAELTTTVSNIVMFGNSKTIFDLKGLLYDPLSLFRPLKKMTLTLGDSNLSDASTMLKLGPTALILEMIEGGASFDDLRLRDPLRAFRAVSLGGPWKQVQLKCGTWKSAIDIQREHLLRARDFFAAKPPGRLCHDEILDLWEETLHRLAERPQGLTDTLDWAAKKSLLDAAILPQSNWKQFFAWGHVFEMGGDRFLGEASSFADFCRRVPLWKRWRVRHTAQQLDLDPADFQQQRELYYQTRKIDLRYHELGDEGYQRVLEKGDLIQRLTVDEDVKLASQEPPPDTRARIRGYYIRLSPSPDSLQVNWNEIELLSPLRHIAIPDPFYHRLPGD